MILVSLNCRGLSSGPKTSVAKDLVKTENPSILLIQETKMSSKYVSNHYKNLWHTSDLISVDARGASDDFCILWEEQ